MIQDRHNVIPVTLAVLLHVVLLGSFVVAFDWSRRHPPIVPLAMTATLVTDSAISLPPRVEPEPQAVEPDPPVVEPEPLADEPDAAEIERQRLEEQKRVADLEAEQERQRVVEEARQKLEQQEAVRKAEETARIKAEEEARIRAAEEARIAREKQLEEQRRLEEIKRQEDIKRQREENERERRRLEAQQRREALAAEEAAMAARSGPEMAVYAAMIQSAVQRQWIRPATAPDDLECSVRVSQLPNGEVTSVQVLTCNGNDAVRRSVEQAVYRASPLPLPNNPLLFSRDMRLNFKLQE